MAMDVGAAFNEGSQSFGIIPLEISVDHLGSLSVQIKLGNVQRSAFSVEPGQFAAALPSMTIAGIDLKVIDAGALGAANALMG